MTSPLRRIRPQSFVTLACTVLLALATFLAGPALANERLLGGRAFTPPR